MDLKETNTDIACHHPWEDARFAVVQKIMNKHLRKNKNIVLDIGCGDLFFLKKYAALYPQNSYIGVDTNFTPAFIAAEKNTSNITLTNSLDKVNTIVADCILLLDVLEHIEDDKGFLNMLASKLFTSPDTLLFITVPAFQSLFITRDVFLEHHRRYNYASLKKVVTDAGFKIHDQGYFFFSLLLIRCLETVAEKGLGVGKNKTKGIGTWNHGAIITGIFRILLHVDFSITSLLHKLKIRLPGLSNYIVCQKLV